MAEKKVEVTENVEKVKAMNIYQRMAKISEVMGVTEKNAKGWGYKYVSEDAIQAKLTGAMSVYRVFLTHSIIPGTQRVEEITLRKEKKDRNGKPTGEIVEVVEYRFTASATYAWVNIDNPEDRIESTWSLVGQMADPSQAFGAAETYCNRYFIMKTFQMPTTNDDPDYIRSKQLEAADKAMRGVDSDVPDEIVNPDDHKTITDTERKELFNYAKTTFGDDGMNVIKEYMNIHQVPSSAALTKSQYNEIMQALKGENAA